MRLKRYYEIPDGWEPQRAPDGGLANPLPITALDIIHSGVHAEQNFSRRFVDAGIREGWCTLSQGHIVLHTRQGDLMYTILRMPGVYCCYSGHQLEDDPTGASARAHVRAMHGDTPSPDPGNPHGYRQVTGYECVLDAAQHAQWQRPMGATVSFYRGEA